MEGYGFVWPSRIFWASQFDAHTIRKCVTVRKKCNRNPAGPNSTTVVVALPVFAIIVAGERNTEFVRRGIFGESGSNCCNRGDWTRLFMTRERIELRSRTLCALPPRLTEPVTKLVHGPSST